MITRCINIVLDAFDRFFPKVRSTPVPNLCRNCGEIDVPSGVDFCSIACEVQVDKAEAEFRTSATR